jgi:TIR domain
MTAAEGGGIFISYRRQETSHLAGRLYDRLADRFGEDQVLIDVDTIEPGVDFAEEIFRAVTACTVLLAIIGPAWLTAADERGHRRLDDPDDIVRLEVEAALARAVRVIPILVEGAVMPAREDLPESLAALARRNALPIRHESFRADAGRLVTAIERVLAAPGTPVASAGPGTRPGGDAASDVAQKGSEPAQSDGSRVIRLLADAESIANSITRESSKAEALSGIAKALAATDPGRAERIANFITSKFLRAAALRDIAAALAAMSS